MTAYEGGDRWRWESHLFRGRYDGAAHSHRPVYGALNFADDPYGGSVRFGSSHLRLREEVMDRCTFCFPDCVFEPDAVTGSDEIEELIRLARRSELDPLDRYVEAHVHGQVSIARDVEAVVLDPCYQAQMSNVRPRDSTAGSNGTPASVPPLHRWTGTTEVPNT